MFGYHRYLEIYNEEIRDLLSKSPKEKLELKESSDTGTYVKDLSKSARPAAWTRILTTLEGTRLTQLRIIPNKPNGTDTGTP